MAKALSSAFVFPAPPRPSLVGESRPEILSFNENCHSFRLLDYHLFASNNANYANDENNADLSPIRVTALIFSKLLAILSLTE